MVYDHRVQEPLLEGVEVFFLTGIGVSSQTQQAVANRVRDGATCISLPGLLPERIRTTTGDNGTLKDGSGLWVATTDFLAPHVRRNVQSILPAYDTIRYRFGTRQVAFKTIDADPDRLAVEIS